MANKTVVLSNYFLNGTANLTLLLLNPTNGNIGNGAGDTLTAGSNGLFSAVVTENITGWWNVVVLDGATVLAEGGKVYFLSDTVGTYIVDDASLIYDAIDTIDPSAVTVAPLSSVKPVKVKGTNIETFTSDTTPIRMPVWSGTSGTTPVDLEAMRPLAVIISDKTSKSVIQQVDDADITIDTTNYFSFTPSSAAVSEENIHRYTLRKATGSKEVLARGDFQVFWEPQD